MKSSEVAKAIQKELIGEDIEISTFSSISNIVENSVVFAKKFHKQYADALNNANKVLAIVCEGYEGLSVPHIISSNPRLDFMKVVGSFFVDKDALIGVHPTAIIEKGAVISKHVSIGAHCYIGPRVKIGDDTIILPNCSIYGRVTIGHDCYIKPSTVIGGPGFGFEYDENGVPVHFPHTGEVIIGNNVYIGSNTTIDRATIDATIIEDNVKIDNNVLVGHNSHIKKNTMIAGGTVLCGGSTIGENSWVSPNSSVLQHLIVGDNAMVGMGAVVVENVKDGFSVFGNPARIIGKK